VFSRKDSATQETPGAARPPAGYGPAGDYAAFDSSDDLNLIAYWRIVRKRMRAILLLTLLVTLLGVAYAYTQPVIYRSTASVLVESNQPTSAKKIEEDAPVSVYGDNLETQLQILKSRNVLSRAVRETRLWDHPEFDPRVGAQDQGWMGQVKRSLGIATESSTQSQVNWTEELLVESLIGTFNSRGTTQIVPRSRLVRVSFDSQDPMLAARAVNTWVKVFIEADRESRLETSKSLNSWLEERAVELQKNVNTAERALQDYREKNNLVAVRGATQSVSSQQMEGLQPKVITARVKVTELATAIKQTQAVKDNDYTTVPWVMGYGGVPSAKEREISARFKVAELSQNYGFEHPRMIQAQAELREATENLRRQVAVAVASLNREYENAKATEKALERELEGERERTQRVNRAEFQLGLLEREVQVNRQLYDVFMARAKEVDVTADIEKSVARVVDSAIPNLTPFAPDKTQLILIFFAVGLVGSMALAIGVDKLDNTIKGPQDAENRLGIPVISAMPKLDSDDEQEIIEQYSREPSGLFSEAIRTARTGLMLTALDDPSRVFMLTSASPGEGKTTLALNLAVALAQSKRTILIEADMRKPRLAQALGLPDKARGLANLVAGNAIAEECIHAMKGSDLKVIPAGDIPPNPLELLSSQRFVKTIDALREQFEFVVIDTPPVELVSDALAISRVASATLFVARAGRTPLPMVQQAIKRLNRADAKVLGVLLNSVDFEKAHKYYGEYSGYGTLDYRGYIYQDGKRVYGGNKRGYGYLGRSKSQQDTPDQPGGDTRA
jgi:polysaccharide biosynthesis transport protein